MARPINEQAWYRLCDTLNVPPDISDDDLVDKAATIERLYRECCKREHDLKQALRTIARSKEFAGGTWPGKLQRIAQDVLA